MVFCGLSAVAQQTPATPATAESKPAESKPAESKPAEAPAAAAAAAPAPSPVPTGEDWLSGFIDVGYRWRTDVAGSFDTYRSIVNLGSGPKLLRTEFTIRDKKHRLFDRIDVRGYDWGGDPYSTLHVNASKETVYRLDIDYRNFAYFDNVPSFADPFLGTRGTLLNEQSFDIHRRIGNATLEIRPGSWLIPYLAFDHDSSSGHGVTSFVSGINQYPFLSGMTDATESYRGGIRLELPRFHVTLEQGGTTFKSDQNTYVPPGNTYFGSVTTPILGHTLDVTSLAQTYGIRGSSIYSKGLLTSHATNWMDVTGQFLYSQPSTDVNYRQYNYGSFASLNQLLFYTGEQNFVNAAAKMPHTTGSAGVEIRPLKRIRIIETWMTDRLHDASGAAQKDALNTTPAQTINTNLRSTLLTNYNQAEGDIFVDVIKGLVARVGYRYVWGNTNDVVLPFEGLITHDRLRLQRNIILGSLTWHPNNKASITGDVEAGLSGTAYFPTSLYNYQKMRIRGNHQVTNSVNVSVAISLLQNNSPQPNRNDFMSHAESISLGWNPKGGKRFGFLGTWEHSSLKSNVLYLIPQTLTAANSNYWESGNTITGLVTTTLPKAMASAQFSGGGSFLLSAGSRATTYYQPVGKLSVPLGKHLEWNTEWRYYGFGETFYLFESFRTHLVTTGLRFSR